MMAAGDDCVLDPVHLDWSDIPPPKEIDRARRTSRACWFMRFG